MSDQTNIVNNPEDLMQNEEHTTLFGIDKNNLFLLFLLLIFILILDVKIKTTRSKFEEISKYFPMD